MFNKILTKMQNKSHFRRPKCDLFCILVTDIIKQHIALIKGFRTTKLERFNVFFVYSLHFDFSKNKI